MKLAKLRPRAEEDLVEAAAYDVQKGGQVLGERMFDAALAALKPIQRMPAMGSPRRGQLCEIPGVRFPVCDRGASRVFRCSGFASKLRTLRM